MKTKIGFLIALAFLYVTSAFAPVKDKFTPAEMQQISIATPGLFDKSNVFQIDFTSLKSSDYSFPLPVGKAEVVNSSDLDIFTSKGDAVKAMFDGVVRLSKNNPPFGNVIVIRHDNGLETVYGNNAQNLVEVGDRVEAGQTIAIVGESDGKIFCKFSIMVNGARINPEIIVEPKSHRLRKQVIRCEKKGSRVNVSVNKKEESEELNPNIDPFEKSNTFKLNLDKISSKRWAYPLPGAKVISPYGGKRRHGGVDLKTKPNDKIVAAFDGVVTLSGPHYGYGNCIKIKHAYGFETLYSHQSKNMVKVGQKVKAGQVIGLTGRTGRATTEHLHFEVHFRGKRYNPNVLFNHNERRLNHSTLTLTKSGGLTSKPN